MNSFFTLHNLLLAYRPAAGAGLVVRGLAGGLLVAALASCSQHTLDATTETPAAPATASAVVATPAADIARPEAPAQVALAVTSKPGVGPAKPQVAPLPVAAPAPVPEEAPGAVTTAPLPEPAAAATRTQAGRVLDESGRPLIGATVMLRGSTKGTSTDAGGNYSLEVPTGENTFVVGYGGYQDETVVSRDAQPLTVTLLPTPGSKAQSRRGRQ
ncbi:carboxypeptidase-like regulatory domain-containing protein [Hymenobacter sp. UV11]|uniref:carboxypeptidase-like regulatory domain-containing protein n=1 Tax=Hymenobacter sp. UV11 TaxID=1849735 RepID=UPI0010DD571B|nr:carboxypeptidase-like regulatory domain-containing protein [Hymenobacter sp. UV11]TDN38519.1 hypothetical protein A8B98_23120 [Hymenobacter sp. UV11]